MINKIFIVFTLTLLIVACGGNSPANNIQGTVSPPSAVIAFTEEELKDVVWVTPTLLTRTVDTDIDDGTHFSIMIFDGDEVVHVTPESGGSSRHKWKLGSKGQIILADLIVTDPTSFDEPEFDFSFSSEIWKVKDDSNGFKIRADGFIFDKSEMTLLKPLPLKSSDFSGATIISSHGNPAGQFEAGRYRFIPGSNLPDYYGDVSDDRFQNTVLVKRDDYAQRYMLFEGASPEHGILLSFPYYGAHRMELGNITRVNNLTLDSFLIHVSRSSPDEPPDWGTHLYKE